MQNIYQQISANKQRSNLIILAFVIFITGAAYTISLALNLNNSLIVGAFVLSAITSLGSYFIGDKIVLSLHGAHKADRRQYFDFYTTAENLSLAAQIPKPQLYVINSDSPNAFATGKDPQHATVCVTTGLLDKLNRTELEGVIAHELSHIQNYDTRLMTVVSLLIGGLSTLINLSYRSRLLDRDDDHRQVGNVLAIVGLVMMIFAPLIAQLIQLAISRRREFLADASAIKLTRQPSGLINALKIISADSIPFASASPATASMYISNPFAGHNLLSLFSTHPPIADRIRALESMT